MDPSPASPSGPSPASPILSLRSGPSGPGDTRALHEHIKARVHPNTCRVCRQEMTYARDVGRFPLEEESVRVAFQGGGGYRHLLGVWWAKVKPHLPLELREMPAVSSYYRHMSFHLELKTDREPPRMAPVVARAGGYAEMPPEVRLRMLRRDQGKLQRSVLKMAQTLLDVENLAKTNLDPQHPVLTALSENRRMAERWVDRLGPSDIAAASTSGGFGPEPPKPLDRRPRPKSPE